MRQVFVFIFLLPVITSVYSQNENPEKKIKYHAENKYLKEILQDISEFYPIQFYYSSSKININQRITIKSESVTFNELLSQICSLAKLRYKLNKNNVILFPLEKISVSDIHTLSGYVYDSLTGERLIGANIIITDILKGTMSNSYGYYSYSLPKGNYKIICSYIGYDSKNIVISIADDLTYNFSLTPYVKELQEVELRGGKLDKINSVHLGTEELPLTFMRNQPSLMGENDLVQGLKMLPGVQSNTDGFNGLFVRGGTPQQTSFVVDDAPLFNMYHLSGWFSSVNPDAVKEVSIFKSNLPSKTGGSIASIVDIRLRDGNNQNFAVTGGIGTLTSRLTIEGPIVKNKSSFIISGRRSYFDQLINLFKISDEEMGNFYFYDCSGKVNYSVNRKNRLYLSTYISNDVLLDSGGVSWGNKLYTLRWNHLFSDNLFSNLTLSGSNIEHRLYQYFDDKNLLSLNTGINYYSLKYDFTFYSKSNQKINFGLNSYYQEILPLHNASTDYEAASILTNKNIYKRIIYNIYSEGEFTFGPNIFAEGGIRLSAAQNLGKNGHFEMHPEPLLTFQYKIKKNSTAKASYSRNYQYNHGASIFELLIPFDRVIFSDSALRPQYSDHISAGYFFHHKKFSIDFSFEPFLSFMKNQYRFYSQNDILLGKNYYNCAVNGKTNVYGIELSLKRTTGKFMGMVNYTWSKVERKETGNNSGSYFNPFYERRHDITLIGSYDLSNRINVSASWVYMSGNPYNQAYSKYEIRGVEIPLYSDALYNSRMPAYHRMDIGMKYKFGKIEKFRHSISLSVYNVYSRTNSLFYFYSDYDNAFRMYRFYTFKIFPSFSYEFSFR